MNINIRHSILIFGSICGLHLMTVAQKSAERYEIDAKRVGVSPTDKDALPRSREFIRLDSTYYVGWMYEGLYKHERSSDYLGYKNAAIPLQKAFDLINKDYKKTFRTLYNNFENLYMSFPRYQDLFMIFNALKECYDNIEMPQQGMALIDQVQSYGFKNDYGFDLAYQRAWMYHRNRFLTSKQCSFLKNTVQENEQMAFQTCYNGLGYIKKYAADNEAIFGPGNSDQRTMSIYHNLALLHCYNKNYDSSEYYYQRLVDGGRVSWNNFGGMQTEIGNFAVAHEYFNNDIGKSYGRFLREPYYYLPELYVYGGKTKAAINMSQEIITGSGSTPGFGWYNISLARSYLYDGQIDSAEFALDKAANFKELHIGTTLTQSQYDFSINLLRVQLLDKKIAQEKFLNKGWWYSPASLYNISVYAAQKKMTEYVVVNQLSANPERDRLMYDLFCAEATTSFDEAWYLMKDFSPQYFIKKYVAYQSQDKRSNVQRYFKLFAAKFKLEQGDEKDAKADLENINQTTLLDTANEKLFMARVFESLAHIYDEDGNKNQFDNYSNSLMETYPQLIPFSGLKISMQLSVTGVGDATAKEVESEIRDCNIAFGSEGCKASVVINKKTTAYEALITVRTDKGKTIVKNERLIFKKPEGAGKEIALRLFGKSGALVFEPPPVKEQK
jgi:hypothetical protein